MAQGSWVFLVIPTFSFNFEINLLTYVATRNNSLLLLNRSNPKHSLKPVFKSVTKFVVVVVPSFLHSASIAWTALSSSEFASGLCGH